ncbi:hypothetical protein ACFWVU_30330 [Streptomyces sp. NPDC058686]|uniref:hypothetical protein n=1 Tax=Streptomyces sp. NPDC058686 TaxID=3346599 RepID=UPI003658A4D5
MIVPADKTPRRFKLIRRDDVSGISGEGHVADGVQWPDGTCALRWRTLIATHALYDSLADLEHIHGHEGATTIDFTDPA